jgi:hypothetical protein
MTKRHREQAMRGRARPYRIPAPQASTSPPHPKPVGKVAGQNVFELDLLGTRELVETPAGVCVHSLGCLLQFAVAQVIWHDERQGCPTWTGGSAEDGGRCACDVEGGGFPIERHNFEKGQRMLEARERGA